MTVKHHTHPVRPLAPRVQGIGLIEIMVGVAVIGVLLAVALPSFSDLMERRRIVAVASEVSSVMNYAKSEANVIGDTVALHMEDDPANKVSCVALTTQPVVPTCRCYNPPAALCPGGGATVLRLFQLPKDNTVSFASSATVWSGTPQVLGMSRNKHYSDISGVGVTVTGARTGAKLRVEYNDAGRVRTCSPDGTIGGYPTC